MVPSGADESVFDAGCSVASYEPRRLHAAKVMDRVPVRQRLCIAVNGPLAGPDQACAAAVRGLLTGRSLGTRRSLPLQRYHWILRSART